METEQLMSYLQLLAPQSRPVKIRVKVGNLYYEGPLKAVTEDRAVVWLEAEEIHDYR